MKIRRFIREFMCPHRFLLVRAVWDDNLVYKRCEFCGKVER